MNKNPYKEIKKNNILIREFTTNDSDEFIWHADKQDRIVKIIEGNNWKFQFNNKLPIELKQDDVIFIKKHKLHRIIEGNGVLKIKIMENFNLKDYINNNILIKEGIILTEQENETLDSIADEISSAFSSELLSLKGQGDEIKDQVMKSETALDEAIGSLLISILLSTPKLIELLGKLINKINSIFRKEKKEANPGDMFIHTGHKLEQKYIGLLKGILKVTGIAKKANIRTEAELDKASHILLYTILGVAAISAGLASINTLGEYFAGKGVAVATYGVAKGGLATIKANEIIQGIKQILPKI